METKRFESKSFANQKTKHCEAEMKSVRIFRTKPAR